MNSSIKKYVLNKSFALGVAVTIGVFSKYIFGDDNLIEQGAELVMYIITGLNIDLS